MAEKVKKVNVVTPPKNLCCSITTQLFIDPVATHDGQVYERSAIEEWFKTKRTSPNTGLALISTHLVHVQPIKTMAAEWRAANHVYTDKEALALFTSAQFDKLSKMQVQEGSEAFWETPDSRRTAWAEVARLNSMTHFDWLSKQTLLCDAVSLTEFDRLDMLKLVASRMARAFTPSEGQGQYHAACIRASVNCLTYLLEQKDAVDIAPLIWDEGNALHLLCEATAQAGQEGAIDRCARLLLDRKVDTHLANAAGRTPLENAIFYGNVRLVAFLRQARPCDAPRLAWIELVERAYDGKFGSASAFFAIAKTLVESGMSPTSKTHSILHLAAKWATNGQMAMLKWALTLGIDVNTRFDSGTALHMCAGHDAVQMLVERGADLEAKDSSGRTPLLLALGDPDVEESARAALLHALGASLDAQWSNGTSARSNIINLDDEQRAEFWENVAGYCKEHNGAEALEMSRANEARLNKRLGELTASEAKTREKYAGVCANEIMLRRENAEMRTRLTDFEAADAKRAESNRKRRESRKRKAAEDAPGERAAKKQEVEAEDLTLD